MDRRKIHRSVGGRSMQAIEHPAFQLLLQERASQALGDAAHASCRRDLYGTTIPGFAQNCSGAEERRLRCQSQAHPENHAAVRADRQSAGSQHLKTTSGAHQVPLFAGRCGVDGAAGCLEHRHHVYPIAKRVCISRCRNRLVQPFRAVLSPFQQPRDELLPGRSRRGARTVWEAKNLQYRPRCAIYLEGICSGGYWPGYSLKHGWPRSRVGQCIRGTAMEIGEV